MTNVQELEKQAKNGDLLSLYLLGEAYYYGYNTAKDEVQAYNYYKQGAEKDYAKCIYGLAIYYELSNTVQKDKNKALEYYQKAFPTLVKEANLGDKYSQYCVGNYYFSGTMGISRDDNLAVEWFTKSANQGYADAQCQLGFYYSDIDEEQKSTEWYTKAANQGHPPAQFCLGMRYEDGFGTNRDTQKALELYKESANQGYSIAQFRLGYCYEKGAIVEKNDQMAVEWYTKSANQGFPRAQYYLALCYENGKGVAMDTARAQALFIQAAQNGSGSAKRYCQENDIPF